MNKRFSRQGNKIKLRRSIKKLFISLAIYVVFKVLTKKSKLISMHKFFLSKSSSSSSSSLTYLEHTYQ